MSKNDKKKAAEAKSLLNKCTECMLTGNFKTGCRDLPKLLGVEANSQDLEECKDLPTVINKTGLKKCIKKLTGEKYVVNNPDPDKNNTTNTSIHAPEALKACVIDIYNNMRSQSPSKCEACQELEKIDKDAYQGLEIGAEYALSSAVAPWINLFKYAPKGTEPVDCLINLGEYGITFYPSCSKINKACCYSKNKVECCDALNNADAPY